MLKNKAKKRLVSNLVVAGLLTMLHASLPMNSQPRPGETIQQTAQRERLKKDVEQKIDHIRSINWRLKAVQIAIPSIMLTTPFLITPLPAIVLFWATSATADIAKKVFKVSMKSVAEAFKNAKELEQFEKDNLITLSLKQKVVIKKLRKRQKSIIIKSIIKNLRLDGIRTKLVNEAMQAHFSFVTPLITKKNMSEKDIWRLFARYIRARWNEKTLQKQVAELFKEEQKTTTYPLKTNLKKLRGKRKKQLNKSKKQVEQFEVQYPDLRVTLEKEVEAYTNEANKLLLELEKSIVRSKK